MTNVDGYKVHVENTNKISEINDFLKTTPTFSMKSVAKPFSGSVGTVHSRPV